MLLHTLLFGFHLYTVLTHVINRPLITTFIISWNRTANNYLWNTNTQVSFHVSFLFVCLVEGVLSVVTRALGQNHIYFGFIYFTICKVIGFLLVDR